MNPLIPASARAGLVLASRSPRRFDILTGLGFEFEVDPAREDIEDDVGASTAGNVFGLAEALARRKCADVASRRGDALVLAADTVVIVDGEVLNKPRDDQEAIGFLQRLSGATHTVVTGLALQRAGAGVDLSGSQRTRVTFRSLSDAVIAGYVATGEGRDKAGSYAAQGLGAGLIRSIEGCFYNVVGLPVSLLFDLLERV